MTTQTRHHHGNLRPALISAGIDILEAEGISGLSLRKIAVRVGVSHAAPAHHFDGKIALLVAIAAEGFLIFSQMMEESRDKAAADPRSKLIGLCQGYLGFAAQHEALFELIFSTDVKNHADENLEKCSMQAFQLLQETCDLFEPSPHGNRSNAIMIWSLVHGYACLRANNKMVLFENETNTPLEMILPQMTPKTT